MARTPRAWPRTSFADLYEVADPGERIDRVLRAAGLADRAGDACATLSKALRQRVALARALLSDPQVLPLDEPTSGLDPAAARDVHELIGELRQGGITIFLTTHRLEEAERLCDRVAILNTRLRTVGRPDELRDQLFARTLAIRTAAPLPDPGRVFAALPAVEGWLPDGLASYVLAVCDPAATAPAVTRALVARGRTAPHYRYATSASASESPGCGEAARWTPSPARPEVQPRRLGHDGDRLAPAGRSTAPPAFAGS